jgi:hypothetical protein
MALRMAADEVRSNLLAPTPIVELLGLSVYIVHNSIYLFFRNL